MTADELLGRTLLGVAVVVAATFLLTPVLRRLGQPQVLAQVLAGILLGPAVLGADASGVLFPDEVRGALSAIGGLGLVLFLFLMGLEIDLPAVRSGGRRLAAITAGSLALPFALGVLAALTVLSGRAPGDGPAFAVFVGTALSVSALPVLARILDERGLTHTALGQLALASASLQDAAAWLLLALCLALGSGGTGEALLAAGGAAALAVLLGLVVRPFLSSPAGGRLLARAGVEVAVLGVLGAAALTQLTGLHAALGALAFGVAFPRAALDGTLERALGPLTRGVLLPVYFLVPGLGFSLAGLDGSSLATIAALLACAAGGKLLGAGVPALLAGLPRRSAAAVAVLLNTRGLVELIVLNVALTNGLIDARLYSELAVVALVTTFMTGPLLRRLVPEGRPVAAPAREPARVA